MCKEITYRMKFLKLRKVITLLAVYVAISGFFYRESFASTSNPTTKAECEINDDRYCSFTCLGGGWKSIGTCSDDNNAKCCSREVSDVACNSTDCGNGVKGVCKPECDTLQKQSGTCASSSSSSKCCVPASCTPTNTTPPTNTDSGTTPSEPLLSTTRRWRICRGLRDRVGILRRISGTCTSWRCGLWRYRRYLCSL